MNRYDTELTTSTFTDMFMIVTTINDAIDDFVKGGWVAGDDYPSRWKELKAYLMASNDRYHEARIAGVKVLAGSVAGRILITFSKEVHNGTAQLTLIGGEDEPDRGCGLQSLAATPNEVMSMLNSVIVGWNIKLWKPNPHASIC